MVEGFVSPAYTNYEIVLNVSRLRTASLDFCKIRVIMLGIDP